LLFQYRNQKWVGQEANVGRILPERRTLSIHALQQGSQTQSVSQTALKNEEKNSNTFEK
jgi:hypothetical protein